MDDYQLNSSIQKSVRSYSVIRFYTFFLAFFQDRQMRVHTLCYNLLIKTNTIVSIFKNAIELRNRAAAECSGENGNEKGKAKRGVLMKMMI